MTELIETAKNTLLAPGGLDVGDLDAVFGKMITPNVDYADLYFQYTRQESWMLEEGQVKSGNHNIDQGVGVRAVAGEKSGLAYSDEILLPALTDAATAARAISRQGGDSATHSISWSDGRAPRLYLAEDPLVSLNDTDKVKLLERVEQEARRQDPRVKEVIASLAGVHEVILVARNDGALVADIRPLVRLNVTVIVEHNGRREQGSTGGGGRVRYDYFTDELALGYAREAARQALVNLEAQDPPAGTMTVVLAPGWPGILLHEAIGHGLEGDFNRKGTSAFAGRIGERVASPACTVVDDGTMPNRRGSLSVDDEGNPAQKTVLIENGILRTYMQDAMNARLMGMAPTGNGRRESFAHLPMPRMTNTYMMAGNMDPQEIIASVDKGLYAVNFGGGQVDITSGKFVFSASEAYLIENGQLGHAVKGATLIGNGPDVLTRVSMVGNDLELDPGVGTCGKEGQSVPVGVGQPTLRIDGITVGGVQV